MSRSFPPRRSRRRRRRNLRRLAIMEAALLAMPALRREIFLAVRLDALSYGEVAQRTGLSVAAVERQMAHALRALGAATGRRTESAPSLAAIGQAEAMNSAPTVPATPGTVGGSLLPG